LDYGLPGRSDPRNLRVFHNLSPGKLARKPFQKRLDRKPKKYLSLRILFPNPIGVINRRNGCGTTLFKKGLTENPKNV